MFHFPLTNERDIKMKGIQLTAYGNLADVVKLADVPLVGIPKADEVIIYVEAVCGAKIWRPDSPKRANSSVGRSIIPIAKARGVKTVNVVRRPELVDEMKALGTDVVLVEGPELPKRVAEATGKTSIALALDCVGDTATQNLLNSIFCTAPLSSTAG